mgnify:CR=1 FL=1
MFVVFLIIVFASNVVNGGIEIEGVCTSFPIPPMHTDLEGTGFLK